jgi:hypothetical protein
MDDDDTTERPQDLVLAFPEWRVDSPERHRLAELVASTVSAQLADWPLLDGPDLQQHYAQHLADAVRAALLIDGRDVSDVDELLGHLDWLARMLAGRNPDLDRYREQLEYLARHLWNAADWYSRMAGLPLAGPMRLHGRAGPTALVARGDYPWCMTRTYEYDLVTGAFEPVADLPGAELLGLDAAAGWDAPAWDINVFPDITAIIEPMLKGLFAEITPIFAMFEELTEWVDAEIERVVGAIVSPLIAFALSGTEAHSAILEPAPIRPALAAAPVEPHAADAPPEPTATRRSYFAWLQHSNWNGISAIGTLLGLLLAILAYLQSLSS